MGLMENKSVKFVCLFEAKHPPDSVITYQWYLLGPEQSSKEEILLTSTEQSLIYLPSSRFHDHHLRCRVTSIAKSLQDHSSLLQLNATTRLNILCEFPNAGFNSSLVGKGLPVASLLSIIFKCTNLLAAAYLDSVGPTFENKRDQVVVIQREPSFATAASSGNPNSADFDTQLIDPSSNGISLSCTVHANPQVHF
ncbi:hypothetical protein Ciccas_003013 [Cichlidogyrus casuarinus]|uniref:Ig-like domain-containing protein n=1 Tax=Cichlidogyrus casuarinus TaxID=1844966 RepID=A0ABD2QFU2_9PLAT